MRRRVADGSREDGATADRECPELLDDGQEEVFAKSAVERGVVQDPQALGPKALAQNPKSDVDLRRRRDVCRPGLASPHPRTPD